MMKSIEQSQSILIASYYSDLEDSIGGGSEDEEDIVDETLDIEQHLSSETDVNNAVKSSNSLLIDPTDFLTTESLRTHDLLSADENVLAAKEAFAGTIRFTYIQCIALV